MSRGKGNLDQLGIDWLAHLRWHGAKAGFVNTPSGGGRGGIPLHDHHDLSVGVSLVNLVRASKVSSMSAMAAASLACKVITMCERK